MHENWGSLLPAKTHVDYWGYNRHAPCSCIRNVHDSVLLQNNSLRIKRTQNLDGVQQACDVRGYICGPSLWLEKYRATSSAVNIAVYQKTCGLCKGATATSQYDLLLEGQILIYLQLQLLRKSRESALNLCPALQLLSHMQRNLHAVKGAQQSDCYSPCGRSDR